MHGAAYGSKGIHVLLCEAVQGAFLINCAYFTYFETYAYVTYFANHTYSTYFCTLLFANMHEICMKICIKYAYNMKEICKKYAANMQEI